MSLIQLVAVTHSPLDTDCCFESVVSRFRCRKRQMDFNFSHHQSIKELCNWNQSCPTIPILGSRWYNSSLKNWIFLWPKFQVVHKRGRFLQRSFPRQLEQEWPIRESNSTIFTFDGCLLLQMLSNFIYSKTWFAKRLIIWTSNQLHMQDYENVTFFTSWK